MSLQTPEVSVRKLQTALHVKAKAEPRCRFYSLWDKVFRDDVLRDAWRRCRANGGAAGVDGVGFADIEADGLERWLGNLQQELRAGQYRPQPLLRVWIPKSSGGERPLGIPTIRDRVVQAAAILVLGPIFEADLLEEQYGFRPGRDAKMALRQVVHQLQRRRRTEIVDADLSDYFNTIPHGALMKCVARRIADGRILSIIKQWLRAPVVERVGRVTRQSNEARRKRRGTPQGGVISPLVEHWDTLQYEVTREESKSGLPMFGDRFSTAPSELTVEMARKITAPLYEALNQPQKKDVHALLAQACHADYKSHSTNDEWLSRDALAEVFKQIGASVPDLAWSVKDIMVSGDRVIVRGEATGTPTGELFGARPTGKSFKTMAVDVFTVRGDQLASAYHVENWITAIQQIQR